MLYSVCVCTTLIVIVINSYRLYAEIFVGKTFSWVPLPMKINPSEILKIAHTINQINLHEDGATWIKPIDGLSHPKASFFQHYPHQLSQKWIILACFRNSEQTRDTFLGTQVSDDCTVLFNNHCTPVPVVSVSQLPQTNKTISYCCYK